MTTVTLEFDVQGQRALLAQLSGLSKQVPYAISVAINRTAEEVLAEGRRQIKATMIVRAPGFVLPPVQLPRNWKATATRPIATVKLGDDDGGRQSIGARRRAILDKFEEMGRKTADDPDFPIAIPTRSLRKTPTALVPRAMYPKSLRLAPRMDASGKTILAKRKGKVRGLDGGAVGSKKKRMEAGLQGIGGTFTMSRDGKPLGVFQRVGRGRRSIRMIWAYRGSIRIPKKLDMLRRGSEIIETRLPINFEGALAIAISTAR
jgi:hypothetical protein